MIKKCRFCNKEFKTENKKRIYCSSNCNTSNWRKTHSEERNIKNRKYELKEMVCLQCNKKFMPDRNHPLTRFCSHKCRCTYNWYNKYRKFKTKSSLPSERGEKECIVCGTKFKPKGLYQPYQKYCGVVCQTKAKQKKYYYRHKEKVLEKRKRWGEKNRQKCNDYARASHFKRKSKIKGSKILLTAKKQAYIRKRDKYTCVYCGKKGESLDHILSIEAGGLDIAENVVVSCFSCNSSKQETVLEKWLKSPYCKERGITEDTINPIVLELLKKQKEQTRLKEK